MYTVKHDHEPPFHPQLPLSLPEQDPLKTCVSLFLSFFLLDRPLSPVGTAHTRAGWAMHWSMGNLPEAAHPYKNNSPLPASHLPIAPQLAVVPRE